MTENKIYYLDDEVYDDTGESSCYLIEFSIEDSTERYLIETTINNFSIHKNMIYYIDKDGNLTKQHILTGESKFICNLGSADIFDMIVSEKGDVYIQTVNNGLIMYEAEDKNLQVIAQAGDFYEGILQESSSALHIRDDALYFSDSDGNICGIDKDGNVERIINAYNINFMNAKESAFLNRWQSVSWCDDYIVIRFDAHDWSTEKTESGLIAFDYNGNIAYTKRNVNYY